MQTYYRIKCKKYKTNKRQRTYCFYCHFKHFSLSFFLKMVVLEQSLTHFGNLFQIQGLLISIEREPNSVLDLITCKLLFCLVEVSLKLPTFGNSYSQLGYSFSSTLNANKQTSYVYLSFIFNHCNCCRVGEMWSCFLTPTTATRAAKFISF